MKVDNSNYNEEIFNLIKRRRFQILINSYIYYKLNDNVVSNSQFDKWVEELVDLQAKYPEISKEVELYEMFKEFTIPGDAIRLPLDGDNALHSRAVHVLRACNSKNQEN